MKKQLQILLSTVLFLAFSMHAIMPLVSHSFDCQDSSSVVFEETEQEDVLSEKDFNLQVYDFLIVEYKFALQHFDQKVAVPAHLIVPEDTEHAPTYIAFQRLKIDC